MSQSPAGAPWAPLLHRRNPLRQWNEKEWWFAYVWDPAQSFYFSWAFVRAFYGDHFGALAVPVGDGAPVTIQKSLLLDRVSEDGRLRLENQSRSWAVRYSEAGGKLRLFLEAEGWKADLSIEPSAVPSFERRENQFVRSYSVFHTYRNRVKGTVTVGGRERRLDSDHTYLDHCFGNVPARTGWHWIALQNRETALTSLVNYGPHAQLYTHVLRDGGWTRLAQDVSFDPGPGSPGRTWRVTSPDLDLSVEPLGRNDAITKMPPLLPFLADLTHTELLVRAAGRIRIDGRWREHGDLVGVMEEHFGRW